MKNVGELFPEMRGAFPSLVLRRVTESKFVHRVLLKQDYGTQERSYFRSNYKPELHPLYHEWYFTEGCAQSLASLLTLRQGKSLFVGLPTVALAASQLSRRFLLVDANPFNATRFPKLAACSKLFVGDILRAGLSLPPVDLVAFDPPWYLEDFQAWLVAAARLTRIGGVIAFPLFLSLLRPTASTERERILELAATFGFVEIARQAITYETPLYEREALRSAGIMDAGNWRLADLVIIRKVKTHRESYWSRVRATASSAFNSWLPFLIANQVVLLRKTSATSHAKLIAPIIGTKQFTYDTVSARDPRRGRIGIWTSHNRVAEISDSRVLSRLLASVSSGVSLKKAIRTVFARADHVRQRAIVEQSLKQILSN